MKRLCTIIAALLCCILRSKAQHLLTPFEISNGKRSATYEECIRFYTDLINREESSPPLFSMPFSTADRYSPEHMATDEGYPLLRIVYPAEREPKIWTPTSAHPKPKPFTILINNGIHPGEPDGIDASMMLMRDIAEGLFKVPDSIRLVVIPVYNIGGALNRNSSTRVNQNGPEEYGFRGNGQNLDLNRDFIKHDAQESGIFAYLFSGYDPEIFIDTHVSDGADYQHTMTLLSTQYDKLGGALGRYFRKRLDPMLYRAMDAAGWPMVPYVNAEETPEKGWTAFYDPPRFSSGYVALFNTIAWVPETHMLKPFDARVRATCELLKQIIILAGRERETILRLRRKDREAMERQREFPLSWKPDTTRATMWPFLGYGAAYKKSEVTGQQRLYYDHSKPLNIRVPICDQYLPANKVSAPTAYIISEAWMRAGLHAEGRWRWYPASWKSFPRDTVLEVTAYTIDSFKTTPSPYEGHYKHSAIHATPKRVRMSFHKGDYYAEVTGPTRRFLIETLEPEGEDSYFAWGFFDAILQRKEGYSDYRWEDVAAHELKAHPEIKAALEAERKANPAFAKDAAAQLFFVYRHSKWYEAAHMRYPVYRIE